MMCPKYHVYKFCNDYANTLNCSRGDDCKFLHLTIMERILYERGSDGILKIVGPEAVKRANGGCLPRIYSYRKLLKGPLLLPQYPY